MKETVLEHLEQLIKSRKMIDPRKVTIQRNTTSSKYAFYLTARTYVKKTGVKPKFFTFEKQKNFADQIKGFIEEHSVFSGFEKRLFILEGFYQKWVDDLNPAGDTIIIAETDGGDLASVEFSHRHMRDFLFVAGYLLDLTGPKDPLSLTDLKAIDWSNITSFEEAESFLLKVKLMKWSSEGLKKELDKKKQEGILSLIKRGSTKEIEEFFNRINENARFSVLTSALADLIHYKACRIMGSDHKAACKEMDISSFSRKAMQLEKVNEMLTIEEVQILAERLIKMDFQFLKNRTLTAELFAYNAPIRLKK